MCISTDTTHHSPKATISLSFESYALLPVAPCCERVVSANTIKALLGNPDGLCAPLGGRLSGAAGQTSFRLKLRPTRGGERLVRNALLHHLSTTSSSSAIPVDEPTNNAGTPDEVLSERLSRLRMQGKGSDKASTTASKGGGASSKGRDSSPVPLIQGGRRSKSGAALCA